MPVNHNFLKIDHVVLIRPRETNWTLLFGTMQFKAQLTAAIMGDPETFFVGGSDIIGTHALNTAPLDVHRHFLPRDAFGSRTLKLDPTSRQGSIANTSDLNIKMRYPDMPQFSYHNVLDDETPGTANDPAPFTSFWFAENKPNVGVNSGKLWPFAGGTLDNLTFFPFWAQKLFKDARIKVWVLYDAWDQASFATAWPNRKTYFIGEVTEATGADSTTTLNMTCRDVSFKWARHEKVDRRIPQFFIGGMGQNDIKSAFQYDRWNTQQPEKFPNAVFRQLSYYNWFVGRNGYEAVRQLTLDNGKVSPPDPSFYIKNYHAPLFRPVLPQVGPELNEAVLGIGSGDVVMNKELDAKVHINKIIVGNKFSRVINPLRPPFIEVKAEDIFKVIALGPLKRDFHASMDNRINQTMNAPDISNPTDFANRMNGGTPNAGVIGPQPAGHGWPMRIIDPFNRYRDGLWSGLFLIVFNSPLVESAHHILWTEATTAFRPPAVNAYTENIGWSDTIPNNIDVHERQKFLTVNTTKFPELHLMDYAIQQEFKSVAGAPKDRPRYNGLSPNSPDTMQFGIYSDITKSIMSATIKYHGHHYPLHERIREGDDKNDKIPLFDLDSFMCYDFLPATKGTHNAPSGGYPDSVFPTYTGDSPLLSDATRAPTQVVNAGNDVSDPDHWPIKVRLKIPENEDEQNSDDISKKLMAHGVCIHGRIYTNAKGNELSPAPTKTNEWKQTPDVGNKNNAFVDATTEDWQYGLINPPIRAIIKTSPRGTFRNADLDHSQDFGRGIDSSSLDPTLVPVTFTTSTSSNDPQNIGTAKDFSDFGYSFLGGFGLFALSEDTFNYGKSYFNKRNVIDFVGYQANSPISDFSIEWDRSKSTIKNFASSGQNTLRYGGLLQIPELTVGTEKFYGLPFTLNFTYTTGSDKRHRRRNRLAPGDEIEVWIQIPKDLFPNAWYRSKIRGDSGGVKGSGTEAAFPDQTKVFPDADKVAYIDSLAVSIRQFHAYNGTTGHYVQLREENESEQNAIFRDDLMHFHPGSGFSELLNDPNLRLYFHGEESHVRKIPATVDRKDGRYLSKDHRRQQMPTLVAANHLPGFDGWADEVNSSIYPGNPPRRFDTNDPFTMDISAAEQRQDIVDIPTLEATGKALILEQAGRKFKEFPKVIEVLESLARECFFNVAFDSLTGKYFFSPLIFTKNFTIDDFNKIFPSKLFGSIGSELSTISIGTEVLPAFDFQYDRNTDQRINERTIRSELAIENLSGALTDALKDNASQNYFATDKITDFGDDDLENYESVTEWIHNLNDLKRLVRYQRELAKEMEFISFNCLFHDAIDIKLGQVIKVQNTYAAPPGQGFGKSIGVNPRIYKHWNTRAKGFVFLQVDEMQSDTSKMTMRIRGHLPRELVNIDFGGSGDFSLEDALITENSSGFNKYYPWKSQADPNKPENLIV